MIIYIASRSNCLLASVKIKDDNLYCHPRPFVTELRLELLPLVSGTHSMADTVVVVQREVAWNGFFEF